MEPENQNLVAEFSITDYIAIIRRRRKVIIQTAILVAVIGIAITLMMKPVYEAASQLLLDPPSRSMSLNTGTDELAPLFDVGVVQDVSTQVVELQSGPLMDQVRVQVGTALQSVVVDTVKDTNVVSITADASDPSAAAAAANLLPQLYIDADQNRDLADVERARQFVDVQGQQAHQKLVHVESQIKQFQQNTHMMDPQADHQAYVSNVQGMYTALNKAKSDIAGDDAAIAESQRLLSEEPDTMMVQLKETNAVAATLRGQLRDLELQRTSQSQPGGYGPQAPQMKALDAQIAGLKQQIAQQPSLVSNTSSVPNAVRTDLRSGIAKMQADKVAEMSALAQDQSQLQSAVQLSSKFPTWAMQIAELQREKEQALALDAMFTQKYAELSLREQAHRPHAHIIATASAPPIPIRPKKALNILLALVAGAIVGLCVGILSEYLDDRINTTEDAERAMGLPTLVRVPALTSTDARLLPKMRSVDAAAESYRVLRTNIQFAAVGQELRTLLVSSSSPGEGKTTTAANLAFAMAMDGKRVILVDTDLRRPSVHKLLELPSVPGLTDLLLDRCSLDEVLLKNEDLPQLSVITAGTTPPNPSELLNSRAFRNIVERLMSRADLIIFDSPPVLAASDAQILAAQMDGVVLVVSSGETKKAAGRQCVDLLKRARAQVLGMAYNKMNSSDATYYYYYHYSSTPQAGLPAKPADPILTSSSEIEE